MLRPLAWCLGLGTAAAAIAVETGAAGSFAGALIGSVVGSAAGNFGHEVCKILDRRVLGKLLDGRSGISENHVVIQALRLAQLKALETFSSALTVARGCRRRGGTRNCSPYRRTIAAAGFKTNTDSPALIDIGAFGGDPPQDILRGQYRRHPAPR
jgi:hypothetical protein